MTTKVKTGEVNWRDYAGNLWLAESWQEGDVVTTTQQLVEPVDPENPPTEPVDPPPKEPEG